MRAGEKYSSGRNRGSWFPGDLSRIVFHKMKKVAGVVLLLVSTVFWTCCGAGHPGTAEQVLHELAFISNEGSNTVTVVDLRTFQVRRTVPVGKNPTGVTASPIRNEIYVVN